MATKLIGTLAGADFTSWSAWLAYAQTLGTLAAPEIAQQQNCELTFTGNLTISGFTPTAANPLTMEPAPGSGFADNASPPGCYDGTRGAAIKGSVVYAELLSLSAPYITLRGLQFSAGSTSAQGCVGMHSDYCTIDACIMQAVPGRANYQQLGVYGLHSVAKNNLIVVDGDAVGSSGWYAAAVSSGPKFINNTIVRPTEKMAGDVAISSAYNPAIIENCIIIGYPTLLHTDSASSGDSFLNCATDLSAFDAGFTVTNCQSGLVPATEFVNPSSTAGALDFRLASTSVKCRDTGFSDATITTDIYGTVRPQGSAYDIGAYEYPSAGAAAALSGTADAVAVGSAGLTTTILLRGMAGTQSQGAADLSAAVRLAGSAQGNVAAGADLAAAIQMRGAVLAVTTVGGGFAVVSALGGAIVGTATLAADMTTAIILQDVVSAIGTAAAGLTTAIQLRASASVVVLAGGKMFGAVDAVARVSDGELAMLSPFDAPLYAVVVTDVALVRLVSGVQA